MRYRTFGGTGLRVSELFVGAMTFGEQGGAGAPAGECRRVLDAYASAGGNVIDTASNYRPIVGARHLDQLLGNLGPLEVRPTAEMVKRLESAADFDPGFPSAFISETSGWVFGAAQSDKAGRP